MSRLTPFAAALVIVLHATSISAQTPRDVLVVGMEAEPPGLDPGQALGIHTLRVTAEIFETLVATAPDSTDTVPGQVVRVAPSQHGAVKGTRVALTEPAAVTDVRLYSHIAGGHVRLGIYDDANPENPLGARPTVGDSRCCSWLHVLPDGLLVANR